MTTRAGHAGGAHQEDEGRGIVLAESAPGNEEEVVDRLLAEQRRLQRVEKLLVGKEAQRLAYQSGGIRVSRLPGLGQGAGARIALGRQRQVAPQRNGFLIGVEAVVQRCRQGKTLALAQRFAAGCG